MIIGLETIPLFLEYGAFWQMEWKKYLKLQEFGGILLGMVLEYRKGNHIFVTPIEQNKTCNSVNCWNYYGNHWPLMNLNWRTIWYVPTHYTYLSWFLDSWFNVRVQWWWEFLWHWYERKICFIHGSFNNCIKRHK